MTGQNSQTICICGSLIHSLTVPKDCVTTVLTGAKSLSKIVVKTNESAGQPSLLLMSNIESFASNLPLKILTSLSDNSVLLETIQAGQRY